MIEFFKFLLAVAAVVGFAIGYWKLLTTEWSENEQPSERFEFFASSLGGLVGGIVAAAFGEQLPSGSGLMEILNTFSGFLRPLPEGWPRQFAAFLYILTYLSFSLWAITVYFRNERDTPKLTQNLAVVSMGLIGAIVTAYLGQ